MSFLTIVGVTEILCSFKLVLQRKTGKEIPESSQLKFLEKFSVNNFALLNAEDNTSGPLDRGGIADLPLLCKFLESNRLFCFISMCKFGSFKNLSQRLLACLDFTLESRFILLLQTKKVISMNYSSSTSS